MGMFDEIKKKAEQAMKDHPDELEKYSDEALKRAGDTVDKVTGDKYADQIDKAQRAGDDRIGS
jgi:MT0933-like antitoxin protein